MTTAIPETTVVVGSCPTCGGPAQFIGAEPEPQTYIGGLSYRHVELPNIDEDLGDGWRLVSIERWGDTVPSPFRALGDRPRHLRGSARGGYDVEVASGYLPSQAYLALRTAIEKRR